MENFRDLTIYPGGDPQADEILRRHPPPIPQPRLNLSILTPADKRQVWAHLKRHHPELAALLKQPELQTLIHQFDATIQLPADKVREALYGHH
jgi:hypothetical protein